METQPIINEILIPSARFHLQVDGKNQALPDAHEASSYAVRHCADHPVIRDEGGNVLCISQMPTNQRIEVLLDGQLLYQIQPTSNETWAYWKKLPDRHFAVDMVSSAALLIPHT